jgi:vacuolar iron transporter family protein
MIYPPKSKKARIERKVLIREFVYGIQDGVISTLGLLSGIHSAMQDNKTTIITGIVAMITGGLSMASASYLASKSKTEVIEKELEDHAALFDREPDVLADELIHSLVDIGLDHESSHKMVTIVRQKKQLFLQTFQERVLGLGMMEADKPFQAAFVMFMAFIFGSLAALLPYFFFTSMMAFGWSVAASVFALFSIGFYKGCLVCKSGIKSGAEFVLVAFGTAGIGWGIGKLFGMLLGIHIPM